MKDPEPRSDNVNGFRHFRVSTPVLPSFLSSHFSPLLFFSAEKCICRREEHIDGYKTYKTLTRFSHLKFSMQFYDKVLSRTSKSLPFFLPRNCTTRHRPNSLLYASMVFTNYFFSVSQFRSSLSVSVMDSRHLDLNLEAL